MSRYAAWTTDRLLDALTDFAERARHYSDCPYCVDLCWCDDTYSDGYNAYALGEIRRELRRRDISTTIEPNTIALETHHDTRTD